MPASTAVRWVQLPSWAPRRPAKKPAAIAIDEHRPSLVVGGKWQEAVSLVVEGNSKESVQGVVGAASGRRRRGGGEGSPRIE